MVNITKNQKVSTENPSELFGDIQSLISRAKQRAAVVVNS